MKDYVIMVTTKVNSFAYFKISINTRQLFIDFSFSKNFDSYRESCAHV